MSGLPVGDGERVWYEGEDGPKGILERSTWTDFRYLKNVDRHNEWTVSAFIAGNGGS